MVTKVMTSVIDGYSQRLELYLKQILSQTTIPAQRIRSALEYSLFSGGKRMRSTLVYLTGELLDINLNILDVIAAAIEVTHCYSLIHDDLPAMDDDDYRRGKLSCHKAFDEATAILVGDGMQALAIDILLTKLSPLLEPAQIIAITRELVQASGVGGMVSGQSLDLSELAQSHVTDNVLREIHLLKTGQLIQACFNMVLAALPLTAVQMKDALQRYAQHLGLVFQMQDDFLDKYAPESLGKARASDLANEKTTFASLMSESELKKAIGHHYQIAYDALLSLPRDNAALFHFTRQLESRTNLSSDYLVKRD